VAALVLDGLRVAQGRTELIAADFRVAFLVIGLLAALSTAMFLALRPEAGAEVSGHRPRQRPRGET
jgi:hypothetical protein